jgi:hypothetical protein
MTAGTGIGEETEEGGQDRQKEIEKEVETTVGAVGVEAGDGTGIETTVGTGTEEGIEIETGMEEEIETGTEIETTLREIGRDTSVSSASASVCLSV